MVIMQKRWSSASVMVLPAMTVDVTGVKSSSSARTAS